MVYECIYSTRFKKDLCLAKKIGRNLSFIETVIDMLANGKQLPPEYLDHLLKVKYWILNTWIKRAIIVCIMALKPSPLGETFRSTT